MRPRRARRPAGRATVLATAALLLGTSCRTASDWREQADEEALEIIDRTREVALGAGKQPFSIDRPSETLRRRLMIDQALPHTSTSSIGWEDLPTLDNWPEDSGPPKIDLDPHSLVSLAELDEGAIELDLIDALRVAASNSRDYQTQKEDVFRTALTLDLSVNDFENQFAGLISGEVQSTLGQDAFGDRTRTTGAIGGSSLNLSRVFQNGLALTTRIGIDIVKLLTPDAFTGERNRSMGIFGDASINIPLMRGAGRHIVSEPLIQAERDTLYAILRFERFKRTFVVQVVSQYLSVLQQTDQVNNAEQNYKSLVASLRQLRRLSDAGRRSEVEVDQAVQDELSARNRWVSAIQSYKNQLDNFRILLGLPTDAHVVLKRSELDDLAARTQEAIGVQPLDEREAPPADSDATAGPVMSRSEQEEITLPEPGQGKKGPWELNEEKAVEVALQNRLDLVVADGQVYDARRRVIIAADALRAEVNLLGSGNFGGRRNSVGSATLDDADTLRYSEASYDALLDVDLPLQRVAERNNYRNAWINLDRAVRSLQELEDEVKVAVRSRLRTLLQAREGLRIQAQAVTVAERRVASTRLFLDAGRAQTRDLLEAQEDLISAQNGLSAALISYRIAELELQRDMGVLQTDDNGLWSELDPKEFF